jgi:isoleucyl-tRNA synthetase
MNNQIFILINIENTVMTTLEMMDSILQYWKENNAFQRSIDERSDQMQFRFFDGPPFAS